MSERVYKTLKKLIGLDSGSNSTISSRGSSMYYTPEPSPKTQAELATLYKSLPVELRRQVMCEVLSTENIVFIFDLFRNANDIKRCRNFKHIRWSDVRNIASIKFIIAFEEFIDYQSIKDFKPSLYRDVDHSDYIKYMNIWERKHNEYWDAHYTQLGLTRPRRRN
jgi:hypothetical protein